MRYRDRLDVVVEVEAEARGADVPSFLLQPLVENAIKYGMRRPDAHGVIRVRASTRGQSLVLWIDDNGPGLPPAAAAVRSGGIGVRNTRQRLETLYPGHHRFELGPSPSGGCRVTIEIPLRARRRSGRVGGGCLTGGPSAGRARRRTRSALLLGRPRLRLRPLSRPAIRSRPELGGRFVVFRTRSRGGASLFVGAGAVDSGLRPGHRGGERARCSGEGRARASRRRRGRRRIRHRAAAHDCLGHPAGPGRLDSGGRARRRVRRAPARCRTSCGASTRRRCPAPSSPCSRRTRRPSARCSG